MCLDNSLIVNLGIASISGAAFVAVIAYKAGHWMGGVDKTQTLIIKAINEPATPYTPGYDQSADRPSALPKTLSTKPERKRPSSQREST